MIIQCAICGTEFVDYHLPPRKYCSRKCYYESRTGKPCLKRRRREQKTCVVCGRTFETGGRAGKRTLFCSRVCQSIARVHNPKVKQMSPTDAAYFAGLMDGEGSVTLATKRQKRNTWRISIANTDFGLLEWCKETAGCGSIVRKKLHNPRHADSGAWQCYSWNAKEVLSQILPFLKLTAKILRARQMIAELDAVRNMTGG